MFAASSLLLYLEVLMYNNSDSQWDNGSSAIKMLMWIVNMIFQEVALCLALFG